MDLETEIFYIIEFSSSHKYKNGNISLYFDYSTIDNIYDDTIKDLKEFLNKNVMKMVDKIVYYGNNSAEIRIKKVD